jgi:hypothetical protein
MSNGQKWAGVLVSAVLTAGGIVATLNDRTNWWIPVLFGACTWYYYKQPVQTSDRDQRTISRPAENNRPTLGWPEVLVEDHVIRVCSYPYKYSSFFEQPGDIPAARISSAFASSDVGVIVDGKEILFLPKEKRQELDAFLLRNQISKPDIREVWSLLAEPFIDQPYKNEESDMATLQQLYCDRPEVVAIRREIESAMLAATFFTMEWGEFTTHDVIRAHAILAPDRYSAEFYWRVMEIALRPYRHAAISNNPLK